MEQETKTSSGGVSGVSALVTQQVQQVTESDVRMLLGDKARHVDALTVKRFVELCKARNLNPFLNEAYLIPFRRADGSYTYNIVVSKYVFLKRALEHNDCDGFSGGVIVRNLSTGELIERSGSAVFENEKLVGAWAVSKRKSFSLEHKKTVSLVEYVKNTESWKRMPATMLEKVALVQALRDHYPDELAGLYTEDELKNDDERNIYINAEVVKDEAKEKEDEAKKYENKKEIKREVKTEVNNVQKNTYTQQKALQNFTSREHKEVCDIVNDELKSGNIKSTAVSYLLRNKYKVSRINELKRTDLGEFLKDVEDLIDSKSK